MAAGGDQKTGLARYCREVAFTYLNRLIALRCMEVRGLLDECIKTRADYAGRSLRHDRFRREHPEARYDPEDFDGLKAFFRAVFGELQRDIQILFDPEDEYSIVMPSLDALRECIRSLNEDIPEHAYKEAEILGWVYQYFQSDEKDRVFEEVRTKKKKIQGDDIVPATSLYTERYMVDFLVQNSLGAIWMEMYPDSRLCEGWPYFVKGQDLKPREPKPVKSLTFLDPACGSGHFLVIAFDLLVQMYEEEARLAAEGKVPRDWVVPKDQIATMIIERNLHGIDIDLRSVQIAWLALYLKMREHQEQVGAPKCLPAQTHLVPADATLLDTQEFHDWVRHEFREEPYFINILNGIAGRLKNLAETGSLARPEEDLKDLVRKERERLLGAWKKGQTAQTAFDFLKTPEQKELPFDQVTDDQFWTGVMNRATEVLDQFYRKAAERGDTRAQVLAHEASRGFAFLDLCQRRYDVVGTNPPYMGSKNMGSTLKKYVESAYSEGKRDLYAAFIQRCQEWTVDNGVTSMVSQQSWMFLRSFVKLRERILRESSIQTLAHLGEHGFADSSAAGAFVALFTLANREPSPEHRLVAFRLIGPKSPEEKGQLLRFQAECYRILNSDILSIPESPIVYWVTTGCLRALKGAQRLYDIADVRQGMATTDNPRFIRFFWEVPSDSSWVPYAKGGGYKKWAGFCAERLNWGDDGALLKTAVESIGGQHWSRRLASYDRYFDAGLTYTLMARGSMGCRELPAGHIFDVASMCIFPKGERDILWLLIVLNTHVVSFLLRVVTQDLKFHSGYVGNLHIPSAVPQAKYANLARFLVGLKRKVLSHLIDDINYQVSTNGLRLQDVPVTLEREDFHVAAILHSIEGVAESLVCDDYQLDSIDKELVMSETGTPSG
ncbi:MAG: BREX-1 system adenine-specific DNA-methyltransferase PglX, partial [Dehalococcoidia bacterium]